MGIELKTLMEKTLTGNSSETSQREIWRGSLAIIIIQNAWSLGKELVVSKVTKEPVDSLVGR